MKPHRCPLRTHLQVRRYVYCDVVRACDINAYVDTTGVQVCALTLQVSHLARDMETTETRIPCRQIPTRRSLAVSLFKHT